jgi:heat shock protein HtpX
MLLAALTGLVVTAGYYLGGQVWAVVALVVAGVGNFAIFYFSDKIVLKMYHAKQVERADSPQLYDIVERLAQKARMPMPKVYVIPTENPNAFATGRSPRHASVAATYGILRMLSMDELEGVMAHELAHVRNRDTLISTVAATLGGAIGFLSRMVFFTGGNRGGGDGRARMLGMLVVVIVAPLVAMLIQMAVSRSREYAADKSGANICGNPGSLANALMKLQRGAAAMPMSEEMGSPATANMFIVNPFRASAMGKLFSTHPPTEERVKRLRSMKIAG